MEQRDDRRDEGNWHDASAGVQHLTLSSHLRLVVGALVVFAVFTFVILLVLPARIPLDDKVGNMLRYGALAGIEIVTVLCAQSLLADKLIEGSEKGWRERFSGRAFQFGLRKPRNALVTARDTLLLLFCALVPLDALSYFMPGLLDYISNTDVGKFFDGFTLETFLTIGIVYNLITGVKEEFVFRGYFLQRCKEHGTRHSAWILSSLFFAVLHVDLLAIIDYPVGPIAWFGTAFLAGLLFSGYALNANRLLPLVLAHGFGNFISAGAIWAWHATGGFLATGLVQFLLAYYVPMIVAGIVLAIVFRKIIRRAFAAASRLSRALVKRGSARDALVMAITLFLLWGTSFILIY